MQMKTNNAQGRTVCIAITAYMIAKAVINMFIGGISFGGIGFLTHLPGNLFHITSNWFYMLEGFADVGCAVVLLILPSVKEHFTNKWSEAKDLFKV